MAGRRRYVLGGLLVGLSLLAVVILFDVIGTVFFALTVAYLLSPVHRQLRRRGVSRRISSGVTTAAALLGTVAVVSPLIAVLVLRMERVVAVLQALPETITFELVGLSYRVVTAEVVDSLVHSFRGLASQAAAAMPVLLVKLALFVLLVFALLYHERQTRSAVLSVVPPNYRDVADALHGRARQTLFAIYVLQAATAIGTFFIALPVFYGFGYTRTFILLAVLAGILQFIPVVGPSILVFALGGYEIVTGNVLGGVFLVLGGGFLIAWVPDLLIRPWLAKETARIPGSLYFIGFVGGLLTLGPIGIIAGPLIVALVVEAAQLLTVDFDADPAG